MNFDINILIVEDLLTTRLFLRRTLKKLGYFNVVLAEDGQAALEVLKQKPFDLSYGQHMPNMDVLDLFEELNKDRKLRDIPFVLITAEKERDKVMEAVAAGIKEYIVKPVKPESLGNKIKEVVFGAA
jgi:two-component system, chemotaxis family, chemotaxis protein CheY